MTGPNLILLKKRRKKNSSATDVLLLLFDWRFPSDGVTKSRIQAPTLARPSRYSILLLLPRFACDSHTALAQAVRCALLRTHACRMLIGACNPFVCIFTSSGIPDLGLIFDGFLPSVVPEGACLSLFFPKYLNPLSVCHSHPVLSCFQFPLNHHRRCYAHFIPPYDVLNDVIQACFSEVSHAGVALCVLISVTLVIIGAVDDHHQTYKGWIAHTSYGPLPARRPTTTIATAAAAAAAPSHLHPHPHNHSHTLTHTHTHSHTLTHTHTLNLN